MWKQLKPRTTRSVGGNGGGNEGIGMVWVFRNHVISCYHYWYYHDCCACYWSDACITAAARTIRFRCQLSISRPSAISLKYITNTMTCIKALDPCPPRGQEPPSFGKAQLLEKPRNRERQYIKCERHFMFYGWILIPYSRFSNIY